MLRRIRAVVGPDVPVVGTLDLHVNMSDAMVETTNLLSAYRTYPHVDWGETGARVARWLDRVLAWGPRPREGDAAHAVPDPGHGRLLDDLARRRSCTRRWRRSRPRPACICRFTPGFPPADIADCGPAVFGYGADQAAVERAVDRLADAVIAAEPEFAAQRVQPVAEAVANAIRIAARRQQAGGARRHAGQSGRRRALEHHRHHRRAAAQGAEGALVGIFHDPDAAAAAHAAGVGAHLDTARRRRQGTARRRCPGRGRWSR